MDINKIRNEYFGYTDKILDDTTQKVEFLISENRLDEANLEKVKRNIVDIFNKMFAVSYKKVFNPGNKSNEGTKLIEFRDAYLSFFDSIPTSWYESLKIAKENEDFEKIHVEELKIEMKDKLQSHFEKCWEE